MNDEEPALELSGDLTRRWLIADGKVGSRGTALIGVHRSS